MNINRKLDRNSILVKIIKYRKTSRFNRFKLTIIKPLNYISN